MPESRKTSNYVAGALGALGGAWLYNKYNNYKQNQNYPYYYTQNTPSYYPSTTITRIPIHNSQVIHYSNNGRPVYYYPRSRSDETANEEDVEVIPAILPSYCEDYDCGLLEPRKTSNYVAGALGALGGAWLYNKYNQYKQNQNYYTTYPTYSQQPQYYNSHPSYTYNHKYPIIKYTDYGRPVYENQNFNDVIKYSARDNGDNEEWWML